MLDGGRAALVPANVQYKQLTVSRSEGPPYGIAAVCGDQWRQPAGHQPAGQITSCRHERRDDIARTLHQAGRRTEIEAWQPTRRLAELKREREALQAERDRLRETLGREPRQRDTAS